MKKKDENKKLPLSGISVLDLTNVLSGPFATLILADLGANVIKVEKPMGDDSRKYGPFINNESSYFISLNRGKKSIVLDLKAKEDKKIFNKLLSKVDVLVDNFKPGVLEKLGYSWKGLSKKYPKLIHSKISGFGETGPYKKFPAYDVIVQAMGGVMSITGNDKKNFVRVGSSIGDIVAGLFCVIGILSQLIWRSKNKLGSKLDLSMLDCQIAILENAIARFSVEKKVPEPLGTDHPTISPFGAFRTKNGVITLAAGNDKIFKKLCDAIEYKNLNDDVLFSTNKKRNKNLKLLKIKIESKLKNKNSEFWIKKFRKSDIPCAPINTIKNIVDDPHLKERKMVLDYRNNKFNSFKVTGNPLKFNFFKEKKQPKKSPKLNENKDEILKFFGIS